MNTAVVPKKGSRTRGLIEYLWGPGRANEHTNPHIVAAWDETYVRGSVEPEFDSFERGLLAREMEAPLRMFGKEPGEHVYHVSVAVHADDGELSDEQWSEVAYRAAEELGFTETAESSAVPWIAMRHGKSTSGNDHIHFVASLCRESGASVDLHNDFKKWRTVREEFDRRWELTTGRERGAGMPGLTQEEAQKSDREGEVESPRTRLHRSVRAAAIGARDEAEFLRRVRRSGVLIRPRWERGGRTHTVGYSVALRPESGYKPVWFGGGKLANDLTLERLRDRWPEPTEEQRADALRQWRPPGWRQMPTGNQLVRRRLRSEAWDEAVRVTGEVRERLAELPVDDIAAWSGVAGEAAGTLSALASRVERGHRTELRRAAAALSRVAQTGHGQPRPRRDAVVEPLAGVARAVADATLAARGGPIAVASLVMQLGRLVREVERAHRAGERHRQAAAAQQAARHMLEHVRRTPPSESSDRDRLGPERDDDRRGDRHGRAE